MKSIKKSIIAVGFTAVSALALGIGVSVSGTQKVNSNGFMGSYNFTAYAEETTQAGVKQITVAEKVVDITTNATFISTDEAHAYTLCLSVIDLADFGKDFATPLQIGYEVAEGTYYNGTTEGLSSYVYSSITFGDGETKLSVSDLSLGSSFENPYFIVAEVATSSVNSTVLNCIVAQKHNLEYIEGTPSTCAVAGNLAYYHCTDEGCDKYFTDSLGLNEIADLTAWKAGEGALALEQHTEVIDEAKAPTCTEDGLTQGSHCSVCGTVIVAQQVDPAKGHTPVDIPAEDPTCTEGGLTAGSYCSVCNTVLKPQSTVPANGHTEVTDEAVAPTCTQTGLTEGSHCSECGEILVAQTEVPALGHTEVTDEAVAPTCTETGLTEGSHCSECGETIVAQQVTDALGHDYVNHICSRCNDLQKVDVNGVYYQLTAANEKYNDYHFVACGKADGFSKYTGTNAETLVLENTIDDISVTEIGDSAFANTDDEESTAIKSVIVPENIVLIGEKAFQNNYGIERVIFLAQTVHLNGSGGNANSTYPFYGCSTYKSDAKVDGKKGNEITKLNIYYNSITAKDSSDWKLFRYVYNGWWYSFYIQDDGGSVNANGSWSMVNTTIAGADIVTECNFVDVVNANVTTGIVNEYYTQTQGDTIKAQLEEALSGYTNNGANKYVVNVTVTNTIYSKATLAITVSLNVPVDVQVNSAVSFSYDLEGQSISAGLTKMKVIKSGDNVILYDPVATDTTYNYTFLGWSKEVDGVLTFIESNTEYNVDTVYYAIWGTSKAGTAFSKTINTTGSTLSAPVGDGVDGSWYDGSDSWNKVTEISTTNTIIYTRSIFTFTYKVSGNIITKLTDSLSGQSKSGTSLSASFTVLEGQRVTGERSSNKKSMTLYLDGVQKTVLTVGTIYTFKDSSYDSGIISLASEANVTFKY